MSPTNASSTLIGEQVVRTCRVESARDQLATYLIYTCTSRSAVNCLDPRSTKSSIDPKKHVVWSLVSLPSRRCMCSSMKIRDLPENCQMQYSPSPKISIFDRNSYACLRPQILGLLLILRSNLYLIRIKMPYSKISILRPQLQTEWICLFFRGRTARSYM